MNSQVTGGIAIGALVFSGIALTMGLFPVVAEPPPDPLITCSKKICQESITVRTEDHEIEPRTNTTVSIQCEAEEKVTGGGYILGGDLVVNLDRPNTDRMWQVGVNNPSDNPEQLTLYAICLRVG